MKMKRIIAGLLASVLLCGSIQWAAPQRIKAAEQNTLVTSAVKRYRVPEGSLPDEHTVRAAAANSLTDSIWASGGGDYYFSLLSTPEKKMYIEMKKLADSYMSGGADCQTVTVEGNQLNILPVVSYESLAGETPEEQVDNAERVINCFILENPQYYFLQRSFAYTSKGVALNVYDSFAARADRASYTEQFRAQLEAWEQQVDYTAATVDIETQLHNLVCENVEYDDSIVYDKDDDSSMSQSCISAVLFGRRTVCAGYAQLFTLLCGRAGIPCISVTSDTHEWNKVRMGTVWYNVDCTWDDRTGSYETQFLNVTDEAIRAKDRKNEHVLETMWLGIVPSCTVAFDEVSANGEDMDNVTAPGKMGGVILRTPKKKQISVWFEPREGCDGYVIQYAANKKMTGAKKKTISTTSSRIIGLKSGKYYYVRVRAFALSSNGTKLPGAYSNKLKIKVK